MRIGWILRGQSAGLMHGKVFTTYPSDDDFRAALLFELERHGIVVETIPVEVAEGEEPSAEIKVTPKERWVRVVEVEIVGLDPAPEPSAEEVAARRYEMRGQLSPEDIKRIGELAVAAPPGTASAAPAVAMGVGTGRVINPGDPGYVASPTKYPGDPRDVPTRSGGEEMTITDADVGKASDVLGPGVR